MMMKLLEDRIFKSAAPQAIRHLTRPDLNTSDPALRIVLDQASYEFQVAPPLTIHMADPALFGGFWHAVREAYVVNPSTRALRETVAQAVSTLNNCPYCVTVHQGMFSAAGGDKIATSARIQAAGTWAANTLQQAQEPPDLPFDDLAQVYGTAMLYHYTNRMVSVFLTDSPIDLPGMATRPGQKLAKAVFSVMSRRMAHVDAAPGQSAVKGDRELPDEFSWARGNPAVAKGLVDFAGAAQAAGREALAEDVRHLLLDHLNRWQGEQPPLSRSWVEEDIAVLDETMKPAGRLALLTARAPWQVDEGLIAEFRRVTPGDKALIQACGWAAFAAARRIAGWFATPASPAKAVPGNK